jgi:hypothetical protein
VLYIVFFIIIKLQLLGFVEPTNPCGGMKGNPLLLPPFWDILGIIPGAFLSKDAVDSKGRRINVCFISEEDITPKILHRLINMLLTISHPFLAIPI